MKTCLRFFCLLLFTAAALAQKPAPTITVALDATEAPRKILHAKLAIPVTPGPLTLFYPKWIPGEHGPTGPVQQLAGLKMSANGQAVAWRRDLEDGWTFHLNVPASATQLDVALDFMSPIAEGMYTAGASATEKMAVISWNTLVLYPSGWTSDQIQFQASVRLPDGWKFGTPLPVASRTGQDLQFAPVSLTTLVDSPIITGQYLRIESIGENPHHEMDIAADIAAALDAPASFFEHQRNLVIQAQKLFGAHHYREYHFLYSLSDHVAHFGLEHHESNDSRVEERSMIDDTKRLLASGLLSHEFVHTWNGKYRRPADLATPDYQKTMQTDLLWVYEGLTSYLGDVLAGRSGLRTQEEARDNIAYLAAELEYRSGRTWRNLQDTADGVAAMQQGAPEQWESWRRGLDYYEEDVLNWLWADVIIRQQSKGQRSLDDFCKAFHGGQSGPPSLKTYNFDDVVTTLNQVVAYDWRSFWTERLTNHGPGAPLGGIEGSGWKLTFTDTPSALTSAHEGENHTVDARYSLGLALRDNGSIEDTIEGGPAAKAGIGPGMKLLAVNGRRFATDDLDSARDALNSALRAAQKNGDPIELLVENTDYFRTVKIDYRGGPRYPRLERDAGKPDLLTEILKAK
jgi:predicted metalloprotease with PDZ domain